MSREVMEEFVNKTHFRFYWRLRRLLQEILSIRTIGNFSKRLRMGSTLDYVCDFHAALTPIAFRELQQQCRRLWEQYLAPIGFFIPLHHDIPKDI